MREGQYPESKIDQTDLLVNLSEEEVDERPEPALFACVFFSSWQFGDWGLCKKVSTLTAIGFLSGN